MIKKTILTAFLLFILYTIFVIQFAPKWWNASQHQWQSNVIKAQNFLYDDSDTIQNVIIGSSLSSRLVTDSLPHTSNLSFGGQCIFDGLKILSHKSKLPKNIFIEMNYVLRPESKEFTNSLLSPILYYPRKLILSLREDKQPIAVLGYIQMVALDKVKSALFPIQEYRKKDKVETKSNDSSTLFSKMLSLQIKEYSQQPDQKILDKSFNTLRDYILKMENESANIVIFEMPVNNKLEDLPKAKVIRETYYKYIPASKYKYISLPGSFKRETTDGLHLNEDEAMEYTTYFKSEIKITSANK